MRQIIGLLGVKGSGKDTCAQFLTDEQDYARIGFADALYEEVADAFGVTVAFLGNRETKEKDLPELALNRGSDAAFAKVVQEELGLAPGESIEHFNAAPRSPRLVLQFWGTEYRRRRGVDSYWLDVVRSAIAAQEYRHFVVTDVRFNNEANFIESLACMGSTGILVRIRRPVLEEREAAERSTQGRAAHPSETELLARPVSFEVENIEGDQDSLRRGIFSVLELTAAPPA